MSTAVFGIAVRDNRFVFTQGEVVTRGACGREPGQQRRLDGTVAAAS